METVKVAVIGTGSMGAHHARIYSELAQTDLVGIVDVDESRGREFARRLGTRYCPSYQELFELDVDAVNIAVPTSLHYPIAVDCLNKGLHVLVEKPITIDLTQAKNLVDLSTEHDLILQVGHLERYNPAVTKLKGIIGNPVLLECKRMSFPTKRNLDVGVVWDLMIHDLDILLNLVDSKVVDINAMGTKVYSDHEDLAQVQLRFENGVIASLTASRVSGERQRILKVTESGGRTLNLNFMDQTLAVSSPGGDGSSVETTEYAIKRGELLRIELEHFADCIRHHKTPMVTGEDGKKALELAMHVLDKMHLLDQREKKKTSMPVVTG